jgi:hypothetical protein
MKEFIMNYGHWGFVIAIALFAGLAIYAIWEGK